jgi:hypothetical protein
MGEGNSLRRLGHVPLALGESRALLAGMQHLPAIAADIFPLRLAEPDDDEAPVGRDTDLPAMRDLFADLSQLHFSIAQGALRMLATGPRNAAGLPSA